MLVYHSQSAIVACCHRHNWSNDLTTEQVAHRLPLRHLSFYVERQGFQFRLVDNYAAARRELARARIRALFLKNFRQRFDLLTCSITNDSRFVANKTVSSNSRPGV